MFSIIAPEAKSLKYRTSLSPLAYVTSRNSLLSATLYISATVARIIERIAASMSPPAASISEL